VSKKIKNGVAIKDLITELTNETAAIRFDGDGYSNEWVEEAKARKLYINDNFTDNIQNIKKFGQVLISNGVCTERELNSREKVFEDIYMKTVQTEGKTALILINKNIIPRICDFLSKMPKF
jgi:glutamine synthetase